MPYKEFDCTYVRDTLFDTNDITEDGNPIIAKAFGVYVANEYGERLVHTASNFTDLDLKGLERAERFAKKVQAHIDAGGELNLKHWYNVEPSYGSRAYQDFGTEAEVIEWERRG
tara:strand:- start:42 stop:383 length:342 start_codon:yes stop_codon:yes gene_type:complete